MYINSKGVASIILFSSILIYLKLLHTGQLRKGFGLWMVGPKSKGTYNWNKTIILFQIELCSYDQKCCLKLIKNKES